MQCVCVCYVQTGRTDVWVHVSLYASILAIKSFQKWHWSDFNISFISRGWVVKVTYSLCSGLNTGHWWPSAPGFLPETKRELKQTTVMTISCSFNNQSCTCLLLPRAGKVCPVTHHSLAQVDFFLRVTQRWNQWPSKNKLQLIGMHCSHPFWPRVMGWPVWKKIKERLPAICGVAARTNHWVRLVKRNTQCANPSCLDGFDRYPLNKFPLNSKQLHSHLHLWTNRTPQ